MCTPQVSYQSVIIVVVVAHEIVIDVGHSGGCIASFSCLVPHKLHQNRELYHFRTVSYHANAHQLNNYSTQKSKRARKSRVRFAYGQRSMLNGGGEKVAAQLSPVTARSVLSTRGRNVANLKWRGHNKSAANFIQTIFGKNNETFEFVLFFIVFYYKNTPITSLMAITLVLKRFACKCTASWRVNFLNKTVSLRCCCNNIAIRMGFIPFNYCFCQQTLFLSLSLSHLSLSCGASRFRLDYYHRKSNTPTVPFNFKNIVP